MSSPTLFPCRDALVLLSLSPLRPVNTSTFTRGFLFFLRLHRTDLTSFLQLRVAVDVLGSLLNDASLGDLQ